MDQTQQASLTAEAILAIPDDAPERLFSGPVAYKLEARLLYKKWHPDKTPGAEAVFHRLRSLEHAAARKAESGSWETPGLLTIRSTAGGEFELRYARKVSLEVGTMYVGRQFLGFDIPTDNLDLLLQAERRIAALTYANDAMRAEFSRYFPEVVRRIDTPSGAFWVLKKDPDALLLEDVLAFYKGTMPARHVAWVLSRLLNIACYLEMQGKVAHNAIGPDTIFISPGKHSAHLLGGWFFAAGLGEPMVAAPQRLALCAPPFVLQKKVGDSRTDMEMIQALGRELLGDMSGVRLAKDPAVPPALVNWLQLSTHGSAVAAYREWQERVLVDAFGPRKFVPMELTHDMLYPTP